MKTKNCKQCGKEFHLFVNGVRYYTRSFCLECYPVGGHQVINGNKKCPQCNETKPLESFVKRKRKHGKIQCYSWCKSCSSKRGVLRQIEIKKKCVEYKGGKCQICGYCKNQKALQFHHLDQNQKEFGLAQYKSRSFDRLKLELDKCELLCANCHAEITI